MAETIILFGAGSPISVEYEESCARRGIAIAAAIRNRPGATFLLRPHRVIEVDQIDDALLRVPFLCPLFTPANRHVANDEALALGMTAAPALIDPTAIVAGSVGFGEGSFVNAGAIIGAGSRLGRHVVINRGASIGHHGSIADFVSIGPGAVLAGQVTVGAGALIGARSVILPQVTIGAGATVRAGAVIGADVPAGAHVGPLPPHGVA